MARLITRALSALFLITLSLAPGPAAAVDIKISAMPSASALDGTESVPVVQALTNKKATTAQIKTYAQTGLATVATSGSATDLSAGTLPAARMPALTGDVTTTAGTVATTIGAGTVSLAKMANMATSSLIYRKTAGSGAPEVNTLATLKTDLGLTGTNSGDQTITLTGDVTGSGTGSFASTLATVNANVGTFGDATHVPQITVNGKGLVTAVTSVTITGGGGGGGGTVSSQAGTTYTGVIGDANTWIRFTNAAAVTFTVPTNASVAYPVGTVIEYSQAGAGAVTVAAAGGVTVNSRGGAVTTAGIYAVASLKKVATDTWILSGDIM